MLLLLLFLTSSSRRGQKKRLRKIPPLFLRLLSKTKCSFNQNEESFVLHKRHLRSIATRDRRAAQFHVIFLFGNEMRLQRRARVLNFLRGQSMCCAVVLVVVAVRDVRRDSSRKRTVKYTWNFRRRVVQSAIVFLNEVTGDRVRGGFRRRHICWTRARVFFEAR